jgi:hypothetical protein
VSGKSVTRADLADAVEAGGRRVTLGSRRYAGQALQEICDTRPIGETVQLSTLGALSNSCIVELLQL